MKVATFNANSIRARLPIILDWLAETQPDVLCVQETKVVDELFPQMAFESAGYHAAFRGQKSYNGVAILSREKLKNVASGFDDGGPSDDTRLIRGTLNGVHIINTYVPQGMDLKSDKYQYKLEWFERLLSFFDKHYTTRQKVLWCGDMNVAQTDIDLHDPKGHKGHVCFNPEVQAAFQKIADWGFTDVFRQHHPEPDQYTFYDYRASNALKQGKGWRIDLIMTTPSLTKKCTDTWIDLAPRRCERPSDHTPLVAEFDV
jgi:exodeoxyribonuclease III